MRERIRNGASIVVAVLCLGMSIPAGRLGISVKTVESHLTRIYERSDVASRTELAMRAVREGWLEAARD